MMFVFSHFFSLFIQPDPKTMPYRNTFLNLAIGFISDTEPLGPDYRVIREGWKVSSYDHLLVKGPLTFQQLIDHLEENYGIELQALSFGKQTLWSVMAAQDDEFLEADIATFITEKNPKMSQLSSFCFTISADVDPDGKYDLNDEEEDAELPDVKYVVREN